MRLSPEPTGAAKAGASVEAPDRFPMTVGIGVGAIAFVAVAVGVALWVSNRQDTQSAATCSRLDMVALFPGFAYRAIGCSDGHNRNVVCHSSGGPTYSCSCAVDNRVLGPDVPFVRSANGIGAVTDDSAIETAWFIRQRDILMGGNRWSDAGGGICSSYPEMQIETE
jgi:hypothetical protein